MEIFTASQTFNASGEFIPMAMKQIHDTFSAIGYKYKVKSESYGRTIIEIQRGTVLHQAVGLRNGLEITFTRYDEQTEVEVRDCLIENQVVGPAILFHYVRKLRIPIMATESIGLVMQANLTKKAMETIQLAYEEYQGEKAIFCPYCGERISREERVCSHCGKTIITEIEPSR